ncbi:hypothetical protein B0H34DRAFT_678387 [Crassisporium funariophilum]|nr:hypothetical protein B0H34DRAFT_678387 [Crassisporium funariophilum]
MFTKCSLTEKITPQLDPPCLIWRGDTSTGVFCVARTGYDGHGKGILAVMDVVLLSQINEIDSLLCGSTWFSAIFTGDQGSFCASSYNANSSLQLCQTKPPYIVDHAVLAKLKRPENELELPPDSSLSKIVLHFKLMKGWINSSGIWVEEQTADNLSMHAGGVAHLIMSKRANSVARNDTHALGARLLTSARVPAHPANNLWESYLMFFTVTNCYG